MMFNEEYIIVNDSLLKQLTHSICSTCITLNNSWLDFIEILWGQ